MDDVGYGAEYPFVFDVVEANETEVSEGWMASCDPPLYELLEAGQVPLATAEGDCCVENDVA